MFNPSKYSGLSLFLIPVLILKLLISPTKCPVGFRMVLRINRYNIHLFHTNLLEFVTETLLSVRQALKLQHWFDVFYASYAYDAAAV
jgi:hypothetical protein